MAIILKNISVTTKKITDLAIELPANEELDLTFFDKSKVIESQDLETALVEDFSITINSILSTHEGLIKHLTYAQSVPYDNTTSSLQAETVQEALDELDGSSTGFVRNHIITNSCGLIFTNSGGFVLKNPN